MHPPAQPDFADVLVPVTDGEWIAISVGHAASPPKGTVILCHGFGGDRRGPLDLFADVAARMRETGWNSVTMDFRGAGESSGQAVDSSLANMVADLRTVVSWVVNDLAGDCVIAIGHSIGGVVVSLAASNGLPLLTGAICVAADLGPYDYGADAPVLFGRDEQRFPAVFAAERRDLDLLTAIPDLPFAYVAGTDERPAILRTASRMRELGAQVRTITGADHVLSCHHSQLASALSELLDALGQEVL